MWFPDWPLDRLRRARRQASPSAKPAETRRPFVLVEPGPKGLLVAASNASARAQGIGAGLRFTDARARLPELAHEEIDREADRAALDRLADWTIRWTPLTALDGEDGLMLETTGCDHLHGGERGMLDRLGAVFGRMGLTHRMGLAATPGAASALARAAPGTILDTGAERAGLAELLTTALRLSGEAETLLRRFGLTRIGQLYGIERTALARRFRSEEAADAVLLRLDQALGHRSEPPDWIRPVPDHVARLPCPEPLGSTEGVEEGLARLLADLCTQLAGQGLGARSFVYHAFRTDGTVSSVGISAARPVRDPAHLARLFRDRLERIDPGFGIDLLMLEAHRTGPMSDSTAALSTELVGGEVDEGALARLADRITAKFREGVVTVRHPVASHLPERSERSAPFDGAMPVPGAGPTGPRPLRMFAHPEPVQVLAEVPEGPPIRFVWRKRPRRVVRADGPERIAPEWWRALTPPPGEATPDGAGRKWLAPKLDPRADAEFIAKVHEKLTALDPGRAPQPRARDYYRVEDEDGRRYWVYRDGLYDDGRGGPPEWFVHGLFA
ncbi:DNA polymerase Y family protein [Pontivivens ytuae]|uniref:DNA-directed DNA polymerase n=1 Tax=Pontivivens ytuae TaxID=2789856 RepID=A0A7S9QF32_9RHOB|nr:DNA polymerase Y family protein [Pontivivens ytuae]